MNPKPRPKRLVNRLPSLGLLALALLGFVHLHLQFARIPFPALHAQAPPGLKGKSLRIPKFDKQNRLESLLSIQEAEQTAGFSLLRGLAWTAFANTNGSRTTNATMLAPECRLDNVSQNISSPGEVRMDLGAGELRLQGRGFELNQTQSSVFISNAVQSVITLPQRSSSSSLTPNRTTAETNRYWVDSDTFSFGVKDRSAVYTKNIHLTDRAGFEMRSERLQASLLPQTNRLDSIVAESNIVVRLVSAGQTNLVQGQRAVYRFAADVAQDSVEITESPTWAMPNASGRADLLKLQPRLNRFHAQGNGYAILDNPRDAFEKLGLQKETRPESLTQAVPAVEMRFGEGDFTPGLVQLTNRVVVTQGDRLRLAADGLRGFLDVTNALQQIKGIGHVEARVSERNQTIETRSQEMDYWLKGERASQIVLRGAATWKSAAHSGKGDTIHIDLTKRWFQATNHASAIIVFPKSSTRSPNASDTALTSTGSPQSLGFVGDSVEILSRHYVIQPGSALFEGQVRMLNPQWKLTCSTLRVHLNAANNQIETVEAQGDVVFERFETKPADRKPRPTGTKEKPDYFSSIADGDVPWKLTCQSLKLTITAPQNLIRTIEASQSVVMEQSGARSIRATGEQLRYEAATELLRLSGTPSVTTTSSGEIRGHPSAVLLFDLKSDTLKNEGAVDIRLPGGALVNPDSKPKPNP